MKLTDPAGPSLVTSKASWTHVRNRALGKSLLGALMLLPIANAAVAATIAATYEFNNNFNADQPGVVAATPVDPLGTSSFQSDVVLGQTRTVWAFNGNALPTSDQAGLTVDTTGLVNPEDYSVDMVFELSDRDGAWRRILDVQNRQSDNGLYVDPSNNLDIFPVSGSTAAWTNNVYHHVVMTNDGTTVNVYLDGISQFTATTSEMNLDNVNNPGLLLGFFLDNVVGGGQGEFSSGRIALARLWNGVLTPAEAQQLANNPFVPEPSTFVLAGIGLVGLDCAAQCVRSIARRNAWRKA